MKLIGLAGKDTNLWRLERAGGSALVLSHYEGMPADKVGQLEIRGRDLKAVMGLLEKANGKQKSDQ